MDTSVKVVLFDTERSYENLLPLSFTRPVAAFRVGITTLAEKWSAFFGSECHFYPREYLLEKFPLDLAEDEEALFIAGNLIADGRLASLAAALKPGEGLRDEEGLWAYRGAKRDFDSLKQGTGREEGDATRRIRYVYDIFQKNGDAIREDYIRIVGDRKSEAPDPSTRVIGDMRLPNGQPALFIEPGATVEGAIINLKDGPVYIGADAQVMEGSCLRGPLAVCRKAKVRMGAKIYGSTTFGPYCKVGGEVDNAVMFGYSNKAHDGYLGNAVIGEWCNIGAGVNASNLKNDYSKIRLWNYATGSFMRTQLQFCGLIMGDHSKAGINCMFNTATVVGVGVNLHGAGFPRPFIPSFSTGGPESGFSNVSIDQFMQIAQRVMSRRGIELNDVDRRIFERVYATASKFKK